MDSRCASPGNCAAGGSNTDGHGHQQGFVVSEKNSAGNTRSFRRSLRHFHGFVTQDGSRTRPARAGPFANIPDKQT